MEEHYFYVLYSLKDNKLYKGYSSDLPNRFLRHAAGGTISTKYRRPLVLIHLEIFSTKKEAMDRERFAKTSDGGKELREILIAKSILDLNGRIKLERP